jgi:hypothetical protein
MNLKKERVALLQSRPKSLIQKRREKKKKKSKYLIGLLEERKLKWRKRLGH